MKMCIRKLIVRTAVAILIGVTSNVAVAQYDYDDDLNTGIKPGQQIPDDYDPEEDELPPGWVNGGIQLGEDGVVRGPVSGAIEVRALGIPVYNTNPRDDLEFYWDLYHDGVEFTIQDQLDLLLEEYNYPYPVRGIKDLTLQLGTVDNTSLRIELDPATDIMKLTYSLTNNHLEFDVDIDNWFDPTVTIHAALRVHIEVSPSGDVAAPLTIHRLDAELDGIHSDVSGISATEWLLDKGGYDLEDMIDSYIEDYLNTSGVFPFDLLPHVEEKIDEASEEIGEALDASGLTRIDLDFDFDSRRITVDLSEPVTVPPWVYNVTTGGYYSATQVQQSSSDSGSNVRTKSSGNKFR